MNTKNSSVREIVLDRCLRSKSRYTMADLMDAVNRELEARNLEPVKSRHTILDDLSYISNRWNVVIKTEKKGLYTYYSYEDPNFSIYNMALSDEEIIHLTGTLVMLKRFQGLPNFEWIQQLIDNCESNFVATKPEPNIISLEENPYLSGLHNLTPIYDAIVHKQVLDIWYHSFRYPTAQKNTVHPYLLKQFNNRWFLFCYNDHRKEISNYPIDRIEKIEVSDLRYIENTFCNFDEYFEDIVGVSKPKDGTIYKVKLWISSKQWPYFDTKPIHGSQKVLERREEGTVIQIEVQLNWELEQLILSQGEHFRVISPKEYRQHIQNRISDSLSGYDLPYEE